MMACCWVLDGRNKQAHAQAGQQEQGGAEQQQQRIAAERDVKISSAAVVISTSPSAPPWRPESFCQTSARCGRMGVTINCSMVPISFSRTMAMAVSVTVTTMRDCKSRRERNSCGSSDRD